MKGLNKPNQSKPKSGSLNTGQSRERSQPVHLRNLPRDAAASSFRTGQVTAPEVYRPQAIPRVLQTKSSIHVSLPASSRPAHDVMKRTVRSGGAAENKSLISPRVDQRNVSSAAVQRFTSRVVQALKIYPNLHPGAVEPIDPSSLFRLASFANQYRLHRVNSHGVNVPNQQYNFVRTREGEMLLHSRYRHPSIAEGKQVLYAGEVFFKNGQLEWWSNGSGHYQPYAEDAEQAALPMDHFFSFQQIIKGEHRRKKG
jgi:hypothetical protein